MSLTIADVILELNSYIGDSSNDRVTAAERLQFITEATTWLQESTANDHEIGTYELDYLDTIHYYKITSAIPDLLEPVDLRRGEDEHTVAFTRKSSREIAEEIGQVDLNSSYAIERRDSNWYLVVNHRTDSPAHVMADFESLTEGDGTWTADTTNSDALNLTLDSIEFKNGGGSLNFDVDVSQSGNNRATVYNPALSTANLAEYENLGSWLMDIDFPESAEISSVVLVWGSDDGATPATKANYWTRTVTTDINGSAFTDRWNELKFDWEAATAVGTPDEESIKYVEVVINYTGSQLDDTDFRIDHLRIARPEKLTFHYLTWYVGTDSSGTDLFKFGATTDIPYYSGQYDKYKFAVAHKAAAIAFRSMRFYNEATSEDAEADKQLVRVVKLFPQSKAPEERGFKPSGINFSRRRGRGR